MFSQGGSGPQLLWQNPLSYLDWKWVFLLQMSDVYGLTTLKIFQEKKSPWYTVLPCRPQTFFLQLGLGQGRDNVDFQNGCCKLEANRANAALRHMLLDSQNILRITTLLLYTYQDFWLLRKIKPYW